MRSQGLIDSHLHLQSYGTDTDLRSVITQAVDSGVSCLVTNGTCEGDWPAVLNLAETYPQVVPFLGLHPWFVTNSSPDWYSILESLVRVNPCGVGEIGLDRLAEPFDKTLQEKAFRVQLELARTYRRPVTIHCVKAWGWLTDILRSEPELPCGMLIHAYSGSVDMIKPLAKMGAYFSFSGMVLLESYKHAREALLAVPPERLLIESDAPFMLPPEGYRSYTVASPDGKLLNHPANLPAILGGVASLLGEPADMLAERLWENSVRFFSAFE